MTVPIITASHGEIHAESRGVTKSFWDIGDYSIATKHLCELARDFAENPNSLKGLIIIYPTYLPEKRKGEMLKNISDREVGLNKIIEEARLNKTLSIINIRDILNSACRDAIKAGYNEGYLSLEDDINSHSIGKHTTVLLDHTKEELSLGEYRGIPYSSFSGLIKFISQGGEMGWFYEMPDFAKQSQIGISYSKNPLYKNSFDYFKYTKERKESIDRSVKEARKRMNKMSPEEREELHKRAKKIIEEGRKKLE